MKRILILGAGGHAQVVADILLAMAEAGEPLEPMGYLDDNPDLLGSRLLGLPVLGAIADLDSLPHDALIAAVGSNRTRSRVVRSLLPAGESFVVARHPSAIVGRGVEIGPGAVICAGAVVGPGSRIGGDAILNTACSVDHHNVIGEHAHIAPGAHLAGEVLVGEGAFVGTGASVIPRMTLGAWSTIGAGACVTKPVPAGVTVVGVPASPLEKPQDGRPSLTYGPEILAAVRR